MDILKIDGKPPGIFLRWCSASFPEQLFCRTLSTHSCLWYLSIPLEDIKKTEISDLWQKETSGMKWFLGMVLKQRIDFEKKFK